MNQFCLTIEEINQFLKLAFGNVPNCFAYDNQNHDLISFVCLNNLQSLITINGVQLSNVGGIHLFYRHDLIEFHIIDESASGKTSTIQYFPLNGIWQLDMKQEDIIEITSEPDQPSTNTSISIAALNLIFIREFDEGFIHHEQIKHNLINTVDLQMSGDHIISFTINGIEILEPTGILVSYEQNDMEVYFGRYVLSAEKFFLNGLNQFAITSKIIPPTTDHHGDGDYD